MSEITTCQRPVEVDKIILMSVVLAILFPVVITAHPLANAEVLEPSVQNEVDHALNVASTNAVPLTAAARDFAKLYETNGMNATSRAISLVSSQKDGCWYWQGTNVTPVAVRLLRRVAGRPETREK